MDSMAQALSALLLAAAALLAVFGVVGVVERERRAATLSFAIASVVALVGLGLIWLPVVLSSWIGLAGWIGVAATLLYLVAGPARRVASNGRPSRRIDEREIMFARARLQPGSDEFERYYSRHPEHLDSDTRFRRLPGLLSPRAKLAEPAAFASAKASFSKAESMREAVDGPGRRLGARSLRRPRRVN